MSRQLNDNGNQSPQWQKKTHQIGEQKHFNAKETTTQTKQKVTKHNCQATKIQDFQETLDGHAS